MTINRMNNVSSVLYGSTVLGLAMATQCAFAQQTAAPVSSSGGLEEIVVTAEKRSESLQNVPASVVALNSEELERRGISSVASLMSGDVPTVKVEAFAGNQTVLEVGMRGFINPNGSDITNENQVPTYIDDVYYGRQNSLALELNDLERLEVLRGPQGTLFGKNAMGGALRMVSKEPTGDFDIDTKVEGGNYGYWKAVAHIDLPAVGILSSKLDVISTDDNGWTKNPAPGQHNYGVTQSTGGKLTLLFKFSDDFKVEYAGDYTSLRSTEYWNAQLNYSATGAPYSAAWPNQLRTPLSEPYATYRPYDPQTYWGNRLNVDWDLGNNISFKSISAMRVDKADLYNTAATSSVVPGPFFLPQGACPAAGILCTSLLTDPVPEYEIRHRQFSQEFQLVGKTDHWDWVAGLFYIKETGTQDEVTNFGTILPNSIPAAYPYLPVSPSSSAVLSPLFGPVGTAGADVTESSKAAFAQATYHPAAFDDKLAVTVGLRASRDDKSAVRPADGGEVYISPTYPAFPNGPIAAGLPCPQSPECSPSLAHTEVSPMVAVAYNWTPDVSTYARFSTGYQGAALGVGSQTFKYVDPSTVYSYELGVKSEFLDHKARVNVSAFLEDWKKPQENIQTTSSSTVEFFSGPTIRIEGLEFDGAYKPIPDLTLNTALTLLHGHQGAINNPFVPPAGFPPISADFNLVALPKWAASIGVVDDIAHTDYGVYRMNVEANGTASYYSVPNVSIPVASYWLVNGKLSLADISVGSNGGKLEAGLWVRNLFDKSYNVFIYQVGGPNTDGAYGPPRMYGGSLGYKFK